MKGKGRVGAFLVRVGLVGKGAANCGGQRGLPGGLGSWTDCVDELHLEISLVTTAVLPNALAVHHPGISPC